MTRGLAAVAAVAAAALLVSCPSRHETGAGDPGTFPGAPVIVVSIDTLRADRLPAYGYKGVETPALDAFRRDAVLFSTAYSPCPMTLPSHVSILTGKLPQEHGVRNNLGYPFDAAAHATIPALLKRAGYDTGASVSAYVLRAGTGLGPAFDSYDDALVARANVGIGELSRPGEATLSSAKQWIAARDGRPFFFLFHVFEPHAPYEPAEPFKSRYENPYDGEIATADAVVGRLFDFLKSSGIYNRAIVVVLSDHGEGLGDHGEQEHGMFLYTEVIRVPLMVKLPGSPLAGSTVDRRVQLIDLMPTVAALTGVGAPQGLRGASLFSEPSGRAAAAYSETYLPRVHFGWSELRSLVDDRHHYIEAPRPELYDLASDPKETTNVLSERRREYAALKKEMQGFEAKFESPASVSPEEAAKLAALGYLGSVRSDAGGALPDPKDRIGDLETMKRAAQLEMANDTRGAIALYRKVLEANPEFPDAWFKLALASESAGDSREADEAYRRAIASSPALAPGFAMTYGWFLFREGRLDEAAEHARLAIGRSPGAAHILLSSVALSRGDVTAAEREARAAMADSVRRPDAAVQLARVEVARGRFAEAIEILDATKREMASLGAVDDVDLVRGDALARLGRFDEAQRAFEDEIRSHPRRLEAYARLSILHVSQGRRGEAARTLDMMVAANPTRRAALFAADTCRVTDDPAGERAWRARASRLP